MSKALILLGITSLIFMLLTTIGINNVEASDNPSTDLYIVPKDRRMGAYDWKATYTIKVSNYMAYTAYVQLTVTDLPPDWQHSFNVSEYNIRQYEIKSSSLEICGTYGTSAGISWFSVKLETYYPAIDVTLSPRVKQEYVEVTAFLIPDLPSTLASAFIMLVATCVYVLIRGKFSGVKPSMSAR